MGKIEIIYEDKDILLINKPAGIVVNKAESVKGKTIQDWVERKLLTRLPDGQISNFKEFYNRSGIVHRLDKETSGLLIIAKNPESFEDLQRQFKERVVEKKYLALVHGELKPKEGEIRVPVGRLPWNRERFGVFFGGRPAITRYRVVDKFSLSTKNQRFSLLEIAPKTGRTHQIRVHLKYLGHPIVGDSFYGGRKTAKKDRQWCPRLFLHAFFLKIFHLKKREKMKFEIPLSESLKKILLNLKKIN